MKRKLFTCVIAVASLAIVCLYTTKSYSSVLDLLSNDVPSFTETMICPPSNQVCIDGGCGEDDGENCYWEMGANATMPISYGVSIGYGPVGVSVTTATWPSTQSIHVETSARPGGFACCYFEYAWNDKAKTYYITGLYAKCYDNRCCTELQYY